MIDRGFVKWHAFESICPNKETLQVLEENKKCQKPVLFPEEVSILTDSLILYLVKELGCLYNRSSREVKAVAISNRRWCLWC